MKLFAAGIVGALATLATGSAEGAGITVTDAKVQGGKLIVSGKTPGPTQAVTLDAASQSRRTRRTSLRSQSPTISPPTASWI